MILDRAMRAGVMAIRSTGYAWTVLACGVVACFALFFTVQERVESVAKQRFESDVRDAGSRIKDRIQDYADVLYAVRALFQSMGFVSRRDFHNYIESLNLGARYPGFQILNFAQYVTADGKAAFEMSVRRDGSLNGRGYPEFRIRPPGERPAYYVLTYLEPMESNEVVFGHDIAMNNFPINLRGLEGMRDTNELGSSGRLVQIRGVDRHVGLSIRLPVYRAGQPIETVEQRRLAYMGSVGAGFRVRESLDPIIATAIPKPVEFKLYNIGPANTAVTPDRLVEDNFLYSSRAAKPGPADSRDSERGTEFNAVHGFQFGERQLVILFSASRTGYIDSITQQAGVFVLSGGLIITLLLSTLVYSLGRSRHEAQLLAAEMTSELQESKAFLTEAQRVARIGSWMLDLTTNEMRWSAETYRVFGVSSGKPLNHEAFLQHVHPDDRDTLDRAWWGAHKGERYDIEYRVLAGAAIHWVREQAELEFALDGTQRRCVGTVQDITERKQADKALRESEDRLHQAYQEREHLAQDLHDGIVQSIYAVGLWLEQVQRQITEDTEEARKNISGAIIRLNAVIREVRNHIVGLQREELNWMRLLTELDDVLRSTKAAQGVQFSLDAAPIVLARLSARMAHEVLNIVREAVSNSLRHSGGKRGMVSFSGHDGRVLLVIEDDGAGFDVLKPRGPGQGLHNMAARAEELGAQFDIRSRPGHGTRVVVDIPLEHEHV